MQRMQVHITTLTESKVDYGQCSPICLASPNSSKSALRSDGGGGGVAANALRALLAEFHLQVHATQLIHPASVLFHSFLYPIVSVLQPPLTPRTHKPGYPYNTAMMSVIDRLN